MHPERAAWWVRFSGSASSLSLRGSTHARVALTILWALSGAEMVLAAPPWPGDTGVVIARPGHPEVLSRGFDPSGIVWHPRLNSLLIAGDGGEIIRIDSDGKSFRVGSTGGDLEGIAISDAQTEFVYLALEDPCAVIKFDLSTGKLTGEEWDLSNLTACAVNKGLEALTYADGLFLIGHQGTGEIYRLKLLPGGAWKLVETIISPGGRSDLSGLHYDPESQKIFAIYDRDDLIVEMKGDGKFIREFSLPGDDQEGIVVLPDCEHGVATVFVAEDGGKILRYSNYPLACPKSPKEFKLPRS